MGTTDKIRDPYHHVAVAVRLAADGTTVSALARDCDIDHKTAHRILVRLTDEGMLVREGGMGRGGYTYRLGWSLSLGKSTISPDSTSDPHG